MRRPRPYPQPRRALFCNLHSDAINPVLGIMPGRPTGHPTNVEFSPTIAPVIPLQARTNRNRIESLNPAPALSCPARLFSAQLRVQHLVKRLAAAPDQETGPEGERRPGY